MVITACNTALRQLLEEDLCLPVCLPCFSFSLSIFVWYVCILGCGGTLYGDHGSFSSPNYPGTYPNGTHCEWGIMAPRGRVVTITFAQISIDDPGDCQKNFLKLYDGPDSSSPPVGPYCGEVCNPRMQSLRQLECSRPRGIFTNPVAGTFFSLMQCFKTQN